MPALTRRRAVGTGTTASFVAFTGLSAPTSVSRLVLFACLALSPAAAAQHDHGAAAHADVAAHGVAEAFTVEGLRVGEAPPPGSGVGRAGVRFADGGYLSVTYGQPFARGRQVFGGLVAWDSVWALGAHRATELWTTVPLTLGGFRIRPGGYSLLATPGETSWTLHVNARLGAHLADEYDAFEDLATVAAAPSVLAEPQDALLVAFDTEGGLALRVSWANTTVAFPIQRAD